MSIDLSLVRIRQLFSLLPVYTRPTIHVAGTNGKGSVTAILSSIFTSSQVSVGRFNSPHLMHVWDSIFVNGRSIPEDIYRSARNSVEHVDKIESVGASSFEILTATAAQIFEQAEVDIAIFEAGLGGRLDATNVLPDNAIIASAITSVDLDHQQFLGSTPAAIAREKAGISRHAKPCILGAQTHIEVQHAVQEIVQAVGGHLIKAVEVTSRAQDVYIASTQSVLAPFSAWNATLELELPLRGAHQLHNLATALTVLSSLISDPSCAAIKTVLDRVTPSTLYTGVLKTKWPGRLESVHILDPPLTLLVDGAHNPASSAALQSYLSSAASPETSDATASSSHRPRTFILALSHSPPKTPFDTLSPLLRRGDRVAFVPFCDVEDMPWVKNVPLPELGDVARRLVDGEVNLIERESEEEPLNPLRRALAWASNVSREDEVVLAGSLYLVADLYKIAMEQGISVK